MTLTDPFSPTTLTLSTSLSETSRSRQMCRLAHTHLRSWPGTAEYLDLREHHILPYGMPGSRGVREMGDTLSRAHAIVIGFPVYNYNMNASLKAVIERFGRSFENKVVGMLIAAGGRSSFMSAASLATSLMFDYRTWIVPRFVYATKGSFQGEENRLADPEIESRIQQLAAETYRAAWRQHQPVPGIE